MFRGLRQISENRKHFGPRKFLTIYHIVLAWAKAQKIHFKLVTTSSLSESSCLDIGIQLHVVTVMYDFAPVIPIMSVPILSSTLTEI